MKKYLIPLAGAYLIILAVLGNTPVPWFIPWSVVATVVAILIIVMFCIDYRYRKYEKRMQQNNSEKPNH